MIKHLVAPKYHQLIPTTTQTDAVPSGISAMESVGLTKTTYQELRVATADFSPANVLGKGGFAAVYQGTWKYLTVAIKRLESRKTSTKDIQNQIKQSLNELRCLHSCRHDNILALYAYSVDGKRDEIYGMFATSSY